MIEKKIYRTAHSYITAFHAHFVRRQCRVRRECRHSAEWRQCAERCATEIKVGHLKFFMLLHRKILTSFVLCLVLFTFWMSRKENPQKMTELSSRSHPRHLVGKRTAQKDITIDTTSDSQVNSNFPNKWSPASLPFNNYFYLFLYLYITWISTNNNAPHLKSPKNQKQKSRLGTASNKNYWGASTSFRSTNPRP